MSKISLLQLPIDILVNIFKMLQLSDICNLLLTCKTLKEFVSSQNTIWRNLFKDRLIVENNKTRKDKCPWSSLCRFSNNWSKGIFRTQVIVRHKINYMPWLNFYNAEVLLLSVGSNLHCYSTNMKGIPNGKEMCWQLNVPIKLRYDIRTNDISRFILRNGQLVCGNRDGGAAIYNYGDIKQKPHLMCHIEDCHENGRLEVSTVEIINESIIITGSVNSQCLKFWSWQNTENGVVANTAQNIMDVLVNDGKGVRCLALNNNGNQLAIGLNGNSKPILLDTNIGVCQMRAETSIDMKQVTRDVCWHDDNTILYISYSGVVEVIDIRSQETVFTARDPFYSKLYCIKSDGYNAIMAGSSQHSRCVLYDIRNSSKYVQLYFANARPSPVYSLDFDASQLIVAVDRAVSVLDFNVSSERPMKDYSEAFLT